MSRVADGATTRRERILEMLTFIRSFGPKGVSLSTVQQHMSLLHGLTFRKSSEYTILILPEKGSESRDYQPFNSFFIMLANLVLLIG